MKLHLVSIPMAAVLACMAGLNVHAENLGTIGPTYAISETHLLAFIEQRLREKERSGELARLADQARARGIETVTHPLAISGLKPTETARTFYFDPSFTLDRNVLDAQGHLLFAAGMRKNPLEVVSLSKRLLFFDARDRRQVAQARELMAADPGRVKPILTAGSYLALMKAWRVPVYYDQQGLLTHRFGIAQVPALVSQEGSRLRIDELEVTR
jgi:conjugal transfer pilus assembly protein TraW